MILARGPLEAIATARVTFGNTGEPFAEDYGDCYFSADDGIAESRHVFIDGNRIAERLRRGESLAVGELGFGTGLNFLLTWQLFDELAEPGQRLHFWSVDRSPLNRGDLEKALVRWPALASRSEALQSCYPPPVEGIHRRVFDDGRVVLDLVWADAVDALDELAAQQFPAIDAWYLDGFAPRRNRAMWTQGLFRQMAVASRDSATLASYSSAGQVRRDLAAAGFEVSKRPGHGSKRESIAAVLGTRATAVATDTRWELTGETEPQRPANALVLGAGLAGAHVAAALARRGTRVVVLERGPVAGRGSGNPQGVLFHRLSARRSALADFSLQANLFAAALYRQLFASGALRAGIDGSLDGCLQLGDQTQRVKPAQIRGLESVDRHLGIAEAQQCIGPRPVDGGLWQAGSGWLSPPAVCRALLTHPLITVREGCGELSLHRGADGTGWEARNATGAVLDTAAVAIVAAGTDSPALLSSLHPFAPSLLPLKVVRGQTTQIPAATLAASVCHRGYVAPAVDGEHCIGATFDPGDSGRDLRSADHVKNLDALAAALPEWAPWLATLDPTRLTGRAELRCASADYLPLAGPVPDMAAFGRVYGELSRNARRRIPEPGPYLGGLYLSTGYGSRGLSYAALGAELIASQLWGEPLPLPRELQRAVSPARFTVRAIIRGNYHPASDNP